MKSSFDLSALVKKYQKEIWMYLRVLGCDQASADDLTQETFLEVMRRPFDDYDPKATGAYLRRVAKNRFLMGIRQAKSRPSVSSLDAIDPVFEKNDQSQLTYLEALRGCLDKLPDRMAQIMTARFQKGKKSREIALELGLKEDHVNTITYRAKDKLKDCVKTTLEDAGGEA
ncbi:MAG: sigma-70 family RNA polymerase sigma factor [Planctomycetota bacterium]|nr:sigma-70 family RNA polymerase sigma factor [Planctomycetota bacterium]